MDVFTNLTQEFDRQVQNLVDKGYSQSSGIPVDEFLMLADPLKQNIEKLELPAVDLDNGRLPFVIVVKSDLVPTDRAMSLVVKDGKPGITKLFPLDPSDFDTVSNISVPNSKIYVLIDIDRGKATINQPPSEAMERIAELGRSPLTIDEGIAIVTHYPEFLIKNNCFSLLASRHTGDKRVPAIWINANKNPNLGWCWNGNPHTWLGSASCKSRFGIRKI